MFSWLSNLLTFPNKPNFPPISSPAKRIIYRLGSLLIACLLLGLFLWLPWHSQAQTNAPIPPITEATASLHHVDETGLTFQLTLPPATIANETVTVAGLTESLHQAGAPALPYYVTWLAVPPGAEVTQVVVKADETAVTTSQVGYIQAAPQLSAQPTTDLADWQQEAYAQIDVEVVPLLVDRPDEAIYGRSQPYPNQEYYLSEPMYYRDTRLVALHLYPVRYNPVTQELTQAQQIEIQVRFSQADMSNIQPAAERQVPHEQRLAGMLLNYDSSRQWRSFPADLHATEPALPLGVEAYKIEIDEDGIYEITGQALADLGLDLNSVDPSTIEMMQRGQPVAYQFISDDPTTFTTTDRIRFYGWAFDGPRLEKQYISHNIFWLWVGGEATTITEIDNEAGMGYTAVYTFPEEITRAPENVFFGTWTNRWDDFPNEPDSWYWEEIRQNQPILTKTYAITLPHPATDALEANYTVELMPREQSHNPTNFLYDVRAKINNQSAYGQVTWQYLRNVNLTGTVPANYLLSGVNDIHVVFATDRSDSPGDPRYYLNRITVNYERQLVALNDHLQFNSSNGSKEFQIANFSHADPNQALIWEITSPHTPTQISLTAADIIGNGPYTYTIGHDGPTNRHYIATSLANIKSVPNISSYTAQSIIPDQGADWIAITHADFWPAAEQLATHRSDPQFGSLSTHIVDIEDIINQYGYGLPLPEAIKTYLTNGLLEWETAPSYVLLVGQGHYNPRNLDASNYNNWNADLPNFVLTDIVFKDRFQGAIPSDHTFAALIGDDLIPDLAIGRLATASITDTYNVVNKIIQYDHNQLTPAQWQHHYLFAADAADSAGNFCAANETTGSYLPDSTNQTHLCRPSLSYTDTVQLQVDMGDVINNENILLLNYRGHGAVNTWGTLSSAPAPRINILNTTMTDFWQNEGKPLIILSADCLDGNFAWPHLPALSQVFSQLPDVGSVAHWSSTGLGYTFEHSVLLRGLYEGAYDMGLAALGDATNQAKIYYIAGNYHLSEVYSFVLQGDPAMQIYRPDLRLEKSTDQSEVEPGEQVNFDLTVYNDGLYATDITLIDTLPTGLTFTGYESTISTTLTQTGQTLTFTINSHLDWGEAFTITINTIVDEATNGDLTNIASLLAPGWHLDPTNLQDTATVTSFYEEPPPPIDYTDFLYLPLIRK